jgi:hypothetical protein
MELRWFLFSFATAIALRPAVCEAQAHGRAEPRPPAKADWSATGEELVNILAALAKQQGLDPEDYRGYRRLRPTGGVGVYGCRFSPPRAAVALQVAADRMYLVIEEHPGTVIPGTTASQVVLLSVDGRILDRLQCDVSSRFVRRLECEIPKGHDGDGARVVIRLPRLTDSGAEDEVRYPGAHSIILRGREYHFVEGGEKQNRLEVWHENGLCRATISRGKFFVLFPGIEEPEMELRGAEAIRVTYLAGREVKSLTVDDRQQIAALVSTLDVARTSNLRGGWVRETDTLEFLMPRGGAIRMAFTSPVGLARDHWGRMDLRSTAFYDKICELVSKAERGPVRFRTYGP